MIFEFAQEKLDHNFDRLSALSNPSLWGDIDICHPGSEAFASRSSAKPLRLTAWQAPMDEAYDEYNLEWLSKHVNHVEIIVLHCGLQLMDEIMLAVHGRLPRLSLLHLHHDTRHISDPEKLFPAFKGCTPHLTVLRLSMVSIDVDLYSNLTHLCLVAVFFDLEQFDCSAVRLLELPRRSPGLESLVLTELGINKLDDQDSDDDNDDNDNDDSDREDPSVVELAHLQYLRLESLEIDMWLLHPAPIVHHMKEDISAERDVDYSKGWGNTLLDIRIFEGLCLVAIATICQSFSLLSNGMNPGLLFQCWYRHLISH
jgi:hypothetical protein